MRLLLFRYHYVGCSGPVRTQGDGRESKAGLGRAWASKLSRPARAEELDGGRRQHSPRLRYHTMARG